jgi:hypothetical protein
MGSRGTRFLSSVRIIPRLRQDRGGPYYICIQGRALATPDLPNSPSTSLLAHPTKLPTEECRCEVEPCF